MNTGRHSGVPCNFQKLEWPKRSPHRNRAVVAHHSASTEESCKHANRKICDRVPMEIVHKHSSFGDAPHLSEDASAAFVRKMVKKQRCHDHIKRPIAKWKLERIADHRPGMPRKLQYTHIDIQCHDAATSFPNQRLAHIARSGSNIEKEHIRFS